LFIGHCVDHGGDDVDVHGIWIILWLELVSSLVSWASCISSSINLLEFVGKSLLSSCRFVWSVVESLDIVSMNSVIFDGNGVPSFLGSGVSKSIGFLVRVQDPGSKGSVESLSEGSDNHVVVGW